MKILIVGAGKLGYNIAKTFSTQDEITIIDIEASSLENINDHLDVLTIKGNGANIGVLKDIGIEDYDLAIATASTDEVNIVVSITVKALGCKKAIARIRNPEYTDQLKFIKNTMDIDYVISPEIAVTEEIKRYISKQYNFFYGKYADGNISVVDLKASDLKQSVGYPLKELDYMQHVTIVAIQRHGKTIIPRGDTIIEEEDILFMVGKSSHIDELLKKKRELQNRHRIRKVMILGGSKVGYYLANSLSHHGIEITLIESNYKRCQELSELLGEDVLIIHGDGTNMDLLEDEDIERMDAFIAVTGDDEDNLFSAFRVKQLGIKKVIAKVSRQSQKHISETLGIDVAISPIEITSAEIIKYVQGGQIVSISFMLGEDIEVIEIVVKENFKYLNKKFKDIPFPEGIIVGAMTQQNQVIIPTGDTKIGLSNRLIVFSLLEQLQDIERFFH